MTSQADPYRSPPPKISYRESLERIPFPALLGWQMDGPNERTVIYLANGSSFRQQGSLGTIIEHNLRLKDFGPISSNLECWLRWSSNLRYGWYGYLIRLLSRNPDLFQDIVEALANRTLDPRIGLFDACHFDPNDHFFIVFVPHNECYDFEHSFRPWLKIRRGIRAFDFPSKFPKC